MGDIKQIITKTDLSYILGSNEMKMRFLMLMKQQWDVPTKLNRKGQEVVDIKLIGGVDEYIITHWDYNVCKHILRDMFKETEKYKRGQTAKEVFNQIKLSYVERGFLDYKWPFVATQFDDYAVKTVVYPTVADISTLPKNLNKIQKDIEKFSYLKIFNTLRNDYIEYLMFTTDEDIIPTFSHRGGIDFYIHGIGFDQKVSRSVTNQFMEKHGDQWREQAINNPLEVAEFLMVLGDEARFSNVPRLFVIDVDGTYDLDGIEDKVKSIDFDSPSEVTYTYNHKSTGPKEYTCSVLCMMITSQSVK